MFWLYTNSIENKFQKFLVAPLADITFFDENQKNASSSAAVNQLSVLEAVVYK